MRRCWEHCAINWRTKYNFQRWLFLKSKIITNNCICIAYIKIILLQISVAITLLTSKQLNLIWNLPVFLLFISILIEWFELLKKCLTVFLSILNVSSLFSVFLDYLRYAFNSHFHVPPAFFAFQILKLTNLISIAWFEFSWICSM